MQLDGDDQNIYLLMRCLKRIVQVAAHLLNLLICFEEPDFFKVIVTIVPVYLQCL